MFVDVLVNIKSLGEKIFTYSVSDDLKDIVRVGFRVIVPLLNREIEGLIIGIRDSVDFETKPIVSLLDSEPVFDDELNEALEKGEIYLGGYCYYSDSPKYHCNDCKKNFPNSKHDPDDNALIWAIYQ